MRKFTLALAERLLPWPKAPAPLGYHPLDPVGLPRPPARGTRPGSLSCRRERPNL